MKKLLFIGSWERDFRELNRSGADKKYNIVFDKASQEWGVSLAMSEKITHHNLKRQFQEYVRYYENQSIDGVVAPHDYPASVVGSIMANALGVVGPSPESVLRCQHKYYSREDQKKYVPQAVVGYQLVDPRCPRVETSLLQYPVILKPVKSSFSINMFKVESTEELLNVLPQATFSNHLVDPFNFFLHNFSSCTIDGNHMLVEECARGIQCTLEGYVYNGEVGFFGVVDSIMYPGTLSFQRFDYPSCLPESVQTRMERISETLMRGIGFDNSIFNIEFMYDPDTDDIRIIEVNPRMAAQFADLYERVDGTNSYEALCDIAAGVKPFVKKREGEFACSSSCVLRTFQNHKVIQPPTQAHIDTVMSRFPDARIELYAQPGKTLADEMQDGKSYRYGLIHLGGSSIDEILERFEWCKQQLPFAMEPIF